MPGVVHFVGENSPAEIPDEEIEQVRKAVSSGGMLWQYPKLSTGEIVEVTYGPLAGCRGRIEKVDDKAWSLVISITLLQRSLAVSVEPDWVKVVPRSKMPPAPVMRKGSSDVASRQSARASVS
jgi:transcription antitermination factor NusG